MNTQTAYRATLQPMPYLLENAFREGAVNETRAYDVMRGVLRVMVADRAVFQATGLLTNDENLLQPILAEMSAHTLDEAAKRKSKEFARQHASTHGNFTMFKLCILKAIATALDEPPARRVSAYDEYVLQRLKLGQPRFMLLGRLFFANKLHSVLKAATPGDPNFSRRLVHGAAFDLYLSTLNEHLLGLSGPSEPGFLVYLCTRDEGLADFAIRFPLAAVVVRRDGSTLFSAPWDDAWIDKQLGADAAADARTEINRAYEHGFLKGTVVPIPAAELLIRDLNELENRFGMDLTPRVPDV